MDSTLLLIDLIGAVALLLWGMKLLKGGINTAFGPQLRQFLASGTRNRFAALGSGFLVTLALQSSTAMAVIVSSFVAQGLVVPVMAQAVMLGSNIGTAVVAQILSLDIHWLAPLAIIIGIAALARSSRRSRGLGELALGLGLMLLSLRLMGEATGPMRDSPAVAEFFGLLDDAPVIAIALAAMLAAFSASSLAVILFIASLAGSGGVDAELCLLLVAGANLGGALPPVMAAAAEGVAARRVAVSNAVVRGLGAMILLLSVEALLALLPGDVNMVQLAVHAHLGFNLALAGIFLPLIRPLTRLMARMIPDRPKIGDPGPRHLDESAISDPSTALAAATRETLRVGDLVENMLQVSLTALKSNDEAVCRGVFHLDDQVDAAQEAIKLYLTRIDRHMMNAQAQQHAHAILDYAINLEHVGDIVEQSLSRLTLKKIEKNLQYSAEGMSEIEGLFLDTIENLHLAQHVFLSRDLQMARRLMKSKLSIRRLERESLHHHMDRLHARRPETIQTTALHMDVLRDLKRINGHLISVASPILDEAGMLRESRLRKGCPPR